MARTEIDPQLPYIQVHRNVAAKAARLAERLKLTYPAITYQHVRGALDTFWEGLADRRVLAVGIALAEPMVRLAEDECREQLESAFGVKVDPKWLATVGFLEPVGAGFWRVRGMSLYLNLERARLEKVRGPVLASLGSDPGAVRGGTPVAPQVPPPVPPRKDERREVRGETGETKDETVGGDGFWIWAQELRVKAGCVREAPPDPRTLSSWFSVAMMELQGDDGRLREAWLRFGDDPHWQKATPACPFRAFMNAETGWRKYVPRLRAS
jgi:hypothetical protein